MLSDDLFLRTATVDVDAAIIGVSRSCWQSVDVDEITTATKIMRENQFDVLPIDTSLNTPVHEYFHTTAWNDWSDGSIQKSAITYRDLVPASIGILELVEKFVHQDRHFFFLTHHHHIVGLVSVANLNSREVNLCLFALLCEFERRLADLVRKHLSETDLKSELDDDSLKVFEEDRAKGVDNDVIHYFYLHNLLKVVKERDLYHALGYPSKTQFDDLNTLVHLRNPVTHPVRSLVTDLASLKKLWERIEKLQDILFRLRQSQAD